MTNLTADAIAALTRAESLADSEGFEDSAAYFRRVRSALLSAQGQAGKPVGWRGKTPHAYVLGHHKYHDDDEPLFAQPQPAAGATDEQIDAAARKLHAIVFGEDGNSTDMRFHARQILMAAASPTEKDDGHGRG